ncbi:MAG: type II toxin-antitoxin system VapC family toxin [Planctomycetes bacterium]|nr:type II toxin-antitoxin system VapC family toxin [Planctomycetota bacterium]
MNLLLDTHVFLWFCQDDPSLSAAAKKLIENAANRKLVSVASCWEIAIKAGLGKLKLGEASATYIPAALAQTGFELLPISVAHAIGVESLPFHHRDPFDRLLVAQSIGEGFPIVSSDAFLDAYPIKRLW